MLHGDNSTSNEDEAGLVGDFLGQSVHLRKMVSHCNLVLVAVFDKTTHHSFVGSLCSYFQQR